MTERVQRGQTNIAGDGDAVAAQASQIGGGSTREPSRQPRPETEEATTTNIRSGNATAGRQAVVIIGDLRL